MKVSFVLLYSAVFLIFLVPFQGNCQKNIKLKNISLEEGLSQNSVLSILKDKEGFMWFGTQDGLNKYDGYTFTVYRNDKNKTGSLSHNYVHVIYEDKKGNLWIGTWGGGLNLFDKEKGTFKSFKNDPDNPRSLSHDHVNGIAEDKSGAIWVATKNGLNKLDFKTGEFEVFKPNKNKSNSLSHKDVSKVLVDRQGTVWAGTWGGGLNRFNPERKTFTQFKHKPGKNGSLGHNIIKTLYEDSEGTIWIGTWGGLNRFDRNTETFTNYIPETNNPKSVRHKYISSIREGENGIFWIGTWGEGFFQFNKNTGVFETIGHQVCDPSLSIIGSMYIGNEDNVWIGTMGNGIYYFYNREEPFITLQNTGGNPGIEQTLSNDDVQALYTDRSGYLWIGTVDGLNKFDPDSGKFTVFKDNDVYEGEPGNFAKSGRLSSNSIRAIFEDRSGKLWIGTGDGGLNCFLNDSSSIKIYKRESNNPKSLSNNDVRAIEEDKFGNLWIGTWGGGLNLFDRGKGEFHRFKFEKKDLKSLSDNFISTVYQDKKGTLWVGTQNGLNRYIPSEKNFEIFQVNKDNPNSITSNVIYAIYEDSRGNLWIGTENGLNKFDRENRVFISYGGKDGLTANQVFSILEDNKKNIWLSTNKGIFRFDPAVNSFQNFDIRDGIRNNVFNFQVSEKGADGRLYFGGIAGVTVFDPDSIKGNTFVPPIIITALKLSNKPFLQHPEFSKQTPIEIPQNEGFFTIEFSALSFALPEKNQYKYKLDGYDEEWVFSGTKKEATYTNLNGGTYTFRVKGSNNNGVWSKEEDILKIAIIPPWWKTLWFKIFGALVVVITAVTGYRVQTYRITAKNKELEARVAQRTQQIELQKREIEKNHDNLNKLNAEIRHKNEELERKVDERTKRLQERELQLRLITDALPVLISYIDLDKRFTFHNKTYEDWFDLTTEQIAGKYIWEVIGEEAYEKVKEYTEQALEGNQVKYEAEMPYKSGGKHYVSTFLIPHVENEKVLGFYALITDISERKEFEVAIAKALKEAEIKNKELVRINTDLDNFVYTASHDLRSPITNLEGLLQLIMKNLNGKIGPFDQDVLEMMNKSVVRLKRTITELGEIAKVQKEFLPEEVLSFKEVINEVKADINHDISESNASIIENLEVENINYPHKHLRSIIYNLISNAIKYRSPDRTPKVEVRTRKVGKKIQLSIMDNGLGLEDGQVKKIFKMFKRLHTHVEGSGVGLYIVKRIVENNGGNISVESIPGKGTSFLIVF